MKKQVERVKKEDEKYSNGKDIKVDNRNREEVFEVAHNGVSIDWTANFSEAISTARSVIGSRVYSINMSTGIKTLRA